MPLTAQVLRAESARAGVQLLAAGALNVYATNKASLFELADKLPGAKMLEGNWGLERHALGVPKGRKRGMPYVRAFIREAIASGWVKTAVARAGLRGAVVADPSP